MYLRLLGIFYKNALISELEYRARFLADLGLSLFWLVWAGLGARVFFFHTETIAGWRYTEVLVVVGLFFTLNGYRQLLIQPNLSQLSEYVRMGTLDFILTRPIDSQFLVSLRYLATFPAQALLGDLDWPWAVAAVLLAGGAFALSTWFWRFALRSYMGASG